MADINTAMSLIRLNDSKAAGEVLMRISTGVYKNQDDNKRFRYEIAYDNFYLSQGDIAKGKIKMIQDLQKKVKVPEKK